MSDMRATQTLYEVLLSLLSFVIEHTDSYNTPWWAIRYVPVAEYRSTWSLSLQRTVFVNIHHSAQGEPPSRASGALSVQAISALACSAYPTRALRAEFSSVVQ